MEIYNLILNGKFTEIDLNSISVEQRRLVVVALDLLRGKRRKFQNMFLPEPTQTSVESTLVIELLQDIVDENYKNLIVKGERYQNYVLTQWLAGWAALKMKRSEESEKFYRQAVSLHPQSPKPAWALGEYYFVVRDYSKAIEWYEKSLALGQNQWEFKWVVRCAKIWQVLAGSLYRITFFTLVWLVLSVLATQWIWFWLIPYLSLMSIHGITLAASWRIGDSGRIILISLRSLALTLLTIFIWLLWNG